MGTLKRSLWELTVVTLVAFLFMYINIQIVRVGLIYDLPLLAAILTFLWVGWGTWLAGLYVIGEAHALEPLPEELRLVQ